MSFGLESGIKLVVNYESEENIYTDIGKQDI